VVAPDFRGHGHSNTEDDADLSAATLVHDTAHVISEVLARHVGAAGPSGATAKVILVGHSMGGAIATRLAASGLVPGLGGLVVIDVVEGTALASLQHMRGVVKARPTEFPSATAAIEWAVKSGALRNVASARVSVPDQLCDDGSGALTWRTDLLPSERHWRGWFEGLSALFLNAVPAPRLLVLAGTDRLDKDLTIGQMQGKFQLLLLYGVGHAVQEDDPAKLSDELLEFSRRYGLAIQVPGVPTAQDRLAEKLARARALIPSGGARPAASAPPDGGLTLVVEAEPAAAARAGATSPVAAAAGSAMSYFSE
jgi:protein phosphatase methylesterase 1